MTLSYNEQMCDFICSFDSFNVSFGFPLHLSACIVVDMARWHGVMWVQTQFQTYWVKCYFFKWKEDCPFSFSLFLKRGMMQDWWSQTFSFCFQGSCGVCNLITDRYILSCLIFVYFFFWRMYCMKQLSFKCKHFVHVEMRKWRHKSLFS